MSSTRLHFILCVALQHLPRTLRAHLALQASVQLRTRWPLIGCGVTKNDGSVHVIAVGRN